MTTIAERTDLPKRESVKENPLKASRQRLEIRQKELGKASKLKRDIGLEKKRLVFKPQPPKLEVEKKKAKAKPKPNPEFEVEVEQNRPKPNPAPEVEFTAEQGPPGFTVEKGPPGFTVEQSGFTVGAQRDVVRGKIIDYEGVAAVLRTYLLDIMTGVEQLQDVITEEIAEVDVQPIKEAFSPKDAIDKLSVATDPKQIKELAEWFLQYYNPRKLAVAVKESLLNEAQLYRTESKQSWAQEKENYAKLERKKKIVVRLTEELAELELEALDALQKLDEQREKLDYMGIFLSDLYDSLDKIFEYITDDAEVQPGKRQASGSIPDEFVKKFTLSGTNPSVFRNIKEVLQNLKKYPIEVLPVISNWFLTRYDPKAWIKSLKKSGNLNNNDYTELQRNYDNLAKVSKQWQEANDISLGKLNQKEKEYIELQRQGNALLLQYKTLELQNKSLSAELEDSKQLVQNYGEITEEEKQRIRNTSNALVARIKDFEVQQITLEAEIQALRVNEAKLLKTIQLRDESITKLNKQVADLISDAGVNEDALNDLKATNAQLTKSLKDEKSASASALLNKENELAKKYADELQLQTALLTQQKNDEVTNLKKQYEDTIADLKTKLGSVPKINTNNLQAEVDALKKAKAELEDKLRKEIEKYATYLPQSDLDKLKEEHRKEIDSYTATIEKLKKQITTAADGLEDTLKKRLAIALAKEIEGVKAQCELDTENAKKTLQLAHELALSDLRTTYDAKILLLEAENRDLKKKITLLSSMPAAGPINPAPVAQNPSNANAPIIQYTGNCGVPQNCGVQRNCKRPCDSDSDEEGHYDYKSHNVKHKVVKKGSRKVLNLRIQNSHMKIIRKVGKNDSLMTRAEVTIVGKDKLSGLKVLFPDSGAEVNEITSDVAKRLGLINYSGCKLGARGCPSPNLVQSGTLSEGHNVSLSNNYTYGTWRVKLGFILTPEPNDKNIQIVSGPGQDGIVSKELEFYFPKIYIPTSSWDVLIGSEGAIDLQIQIDYTGDVKVQNCLTCGGKKQNCLTCGGKKQYCR